MGREDKRTKIALIGGAGYLGGITAHYLIEKEYDIIIIDNLSTGSKTNIPKKAKFYRYDMDNSIIRNILLDNKVDIIIILAADISVLNGEKYPIGIYENNTAKLCSFLFGLSITPIKDIIHISSAAVYGHQKKLKVDTCEVRLNPINNYGMTKKLNEYILQLSNFNIINLRLFNIYGSAYGIKKKIKGIIELLETENNVIINGDGSSTRDYVHVLDAAQAIEKSIVSLNSNKGKLKFVKLNVGTGKAIKLKDIINYYQKKRQKLKIEYKKERVFDVKWSVADISYTKFYLGYTPTIFLNLKD